MDPVEQERRRHIRHWARFMIMHMEGRDSDPPLYTYREALLRLRQLIDRELAGTPVPPAGQMPNP